MLNDLHSCFDNLSVFVLLFLDSVTQVKVNNSVRARNEFEGPIPASHPELFFLKTLKLSLIHFYSEMYFFLLNATKRELENLYVKLYILFPHLDFLPNIQGNFLQTSYITFQIKSLGS